MTELTRAWGLRLRKLYIRAHRWYTTAPRHDRYWRG